MDSYTANLIKSSFYGLIEIYLMPSLTISKPQLRAPEIPSERAPCLRRRDVVWEPFFEGVAHLGSLNILNEREFARRVGTLEKLKEAQRTALAELDALFATLQHSACK